MSDTSANDDQRPTVFAGLTVRQWLADWEEVAWDPAQRRRRPDDHFFLFSLPARTLRQLCQVYRRNVKGKQPRAMDEGIQRYYEQGRAEEIARFVRHGYPWSQLTGAQRTSGEYGDLRKPGWLPTAIIVNVLPPGRTRNGVSLDSGDAVDIRRSGPTATLTLPANFKESGWSPSVSPMEIIDGQHRLWAFGETPEAADFDVPVVAYMDLDIGWQAYLFWTINITPKRINPSLAFDLIPLLRTEEWLDRFAGHSIYRQARAQELVEALWSHPESAWHDRINMLGEPSGQSGALPQVSQAAWIRALMASFVKPWTIRGKTPGGLFGAPVGKHDTVLPWSRTQQAAFLIYLWRQIETAVSGSNAAWVRDLRVPGQPNLNLVPDRDLAFAGRFSMLATDQGVRSISSVANDLTIVSADRLRLTEWHPATDVSSTAADAVSQELAGFAKQPAAKFLAALAEGLASYDWRSAATPGLPDDVAKAKGTFRGSGGYAALAADLVAHLGRQRGSIGTAAKRLTPPK